MNTTWSRPTKYVVGVGLVLFGIYVLYLSRSVIPLLIVAVLIAVILRPVITWLQERARLPRGLAVAITYLGLLILAPLALLLVIPALLDALNYVVSLDYQSILEDAVDWLSGVLMSVRAARLPIAALDIYVDRTIDALLASLQEAESTAGPGLPSVATIVQSLRGALTTTFDAAVRVIGAVATFVVLFIFIFLVSIHITLSLHTYQDAFMRAVPAAYRPEIGKLLRQIGDIWNAFFRGQLTLMLVIGVASWIGLSALGVPGALSLGVIAGVLELIPNLGPVMATIPAAVVALLQGSIYLPFSNVAVAALVVAFYALLQQLENNVIVPRVLGSAVDLPPVVVITGVLVGATTAGVLGALLATPVIATTRAVLRYVYRKLLGEDPFPPEEIVPKLEPRPAIVLPRQLRKWFRG